MSTRSGKRLHNSSNENIEPEHVLKKDRKTKSKRVVENDDGQGVSMKTKKRQNYVSFPAEDEVADVEDDVQAKPARALRRNTLKEQNAATEEVETAISAKKQVRTTRRTKKFSETATDEVLQIPQIEEPIQVVTITNSKSKGKKNKKKSKKVEQPEVLDKENDVKVVKKKKNKKKKNSQSNSLVQQEETCEKGKEDSYVSTDSFHSAAGSPAHKDITSPQNNSSRKHLLEAETLQVQTHKEVTENIKKRTSLKRVSGLNTSSKASMEVDEDANTNIELETNTGVRQNRRRSSLKITVPDQAAKSLDNVEKVNLNATFEKESTNEGSNKKKRKSNIDIPLLTNTSSNLDIAKISNTVLNTTFEKDDTEYEVKIKKNKNDDIEEQVNLISADISQSLNTSFEKRRSPRKSLNVSTALNGTFDMSPKPDLTKQKSLDTTFDKETKLDSTFDKSIKKSSLGSKSSLITSDDASNSSIVTLDKSDSSKINITDDDSKTENILNTTPVLIESSMEESKILESSLKENKTPESQPMQLRREGTFTKDDSEVSMSPKTPNKRQTLPSAGCTPYHSNGKSSQKRSILNLTHSIEKSGRRSSLAELAPRATRVMFCSPVNNPGVATQRKSKIIKSNLKGSNKSFVFDESVSSLLPERAGRKRSWTHEAGSQAGAKRARRADPAPAPHARAADPPRTRTTSAMAKLITTPAKACTPNPRSETKTTRLPNFAALHARRFDRMESLDECQRRKAQRAKQLLVPTGSVAVLERSSPRVTLEPKPRDTPPKAGTPAKPAPKLPTLDSLQHGYTRFGFKMNCDVNPFTIPPKTAEKKPDTKPNGVKPIGVKLNGVKPNGKSLVSFKRQVTQPSLAGATSVRREAAKQTIMREKSFTLAEKRNESRKEVRTVIKGVRTNRRFDLQMKSRNING